MREDQRASTSESRGRGAVVFWTASEPGPGPERDRDSDLAASESEWPSGPLRQVWASMLVIHAASSEPNQQSPVRNQRRSSKATTQGNPGI